MSIPFPGFCGPSYQLTDRYATVERTVNWIQLVNEAADAESKFRYALDPTPGNAQFCPLPVPAPFNQPTRGLLELRGSCYGVNGNQVFYISPAGNFKAIGAVEDDGLPVSMVANGNSQIFIASVGKGAVISAQGLGSTVTAVDVAADNFLGASYATMQDGYILVVTPGTNQFQISGSNTAPVGDATQWDAANISIQGGIAGLLRAVRAARGYVRVYGDRRTMIFADVGANGIGSFPFQNYNSTFIETGLAAVFSLAELGDSQMWIGEDERGYRAAWRDVTYSPARVSTYAVEQTWESYVSIADAVAFPFIWKGQLIYRITFPSAKQDQYTGKFTAATWDYYATASQLAGRNLWTEAQYQHASRGLIGRPERFHAFCYGRHLVGSAGDDGNPGAIYQYSSLAFADCGTDRTGLIQTQQPIVRDRITPHIFSSNKRIVVDRLELECARGVGLDGNPALGANPQMYLQTSRDYGQSWGNPIQAPVGKLGQFAERVYFNRLGYARDWAFWLRYSEPTYMGIVNAELDVRLCGS